jgi:hypothetical protein
LLNQLLPIRLDTKLFFLHDLGLETKARKKGLDFFKRMLSGLGLARPNASRGHGAFKFLG